MANKKTPLALVVASLDSYKGAVAEYPFGPEARVYKVMGKMFALVAESKAPGRVTLKAVPADAAALESMFSAVHPGYHMNKKHWITVDLESDASLELIDDWSRASYDLVVSALRKVDRNHLALLPDNEP